MHLHPPPRVLPSTLSPETACFFFFVFRFVVRNHLVGLLSEVLGFRVLGFKGFRVYRVYRVLGF